MAPTANLRLGPGAIVKVPFVRLHPKNLVKAVHPNARTGDVIEFLLVKDRGIRKVRGENKTVIILFHPAWCDHEPFECWALEGGCHVTEEERPFVPFTEVSVLNDEEPNREFDPATFAAIQRGEAPENPSVLPVDDDNQPSPENVPQDSDAPWRQVMTDWEHTGSCHRKKEGCVDTDARLNLPSLEKPPLVEVFLLFFLGKAFINRVILSATNKKLTGRSLSLGEFVQWLGIWLLLATVIGPQRREFWSVKPVDPFDGAPFRVSHIMSRNRFEEILRALTFTVHQPPMFKDGFWFVREIIQGWNDNMAKIFIPSWVSCLDESMSIWINMFSCPGFIFVPRKPHPFGNEYHTICCCKSGILWQMELVEGKDRPPEALPPKYDWRGPQLVCY